MLALVVMRRERGRRGRADRLRPRAAGRLQVPQVGRVPQAPAAHGHRQAAEVQAPRALLGRARAAASVSASASSRTGIACEPWPGTARSSSARGVRPPHPVEPRQVWGPTPSWRARDEAAARGRACSALAVPPGGGGPRPHARDHRPPQPQRGPLCKATGVSECGHEAPGGTPTRAPVRFARRVSPRSPPTVTLGRGLNTRGAPRVIGMMNADGEQGVRRSSRAASAGAESGALEQLYREGFEGFLRVATAICGDRKLARDAVQEGFARAIAGRSAFRHQGPLAAWVWRAVVSSARNAAARSRPMAELDHATIAPRRTSATPHATRGCAARWPPCPSASGSCSSFATTPTSTTRRSAGSRVFARNRERHAPRRTRIASSLAQRGAGMSSLDPIVRESLERLAPPEPTRAPTGPTSCAAPKPIGGGALWRGCA